MMLLAPYLYTSLSLQDVSNRLLPQYKQSLSAHIMPLDDRYQDPGVNQVFKDNILLSLAYMEGQAKLGQNVDWSKVESPSHFEFTLNPNQVFAFHDSVLSDYQNQVSLTTNAHFNSNEGFKSDGYLVGDGVCHLASLFDWAAKDANLDVTAPTNHDFAVIPDIPKQYGVAIYADPGSADSSALHNLFIKNNQPTPMKFVIDYNNNKVSLAIKQIS